MAVNNGFFEIVPDDYLESNVDELPSSRLSEFKEKAKLDGFGETVIESAATKINCNCNSYEEFLKVIDTELREIEDKRDREFTKRNNIKRSIALEIEKLKEQNVLDLIDVLICNTYNTTAVTSLELVEECSKKFNDTMESTYEECKYAVYLCIRSDWVKESMSACLNKWDSSMDVRKYIVNYLKTVGYDEENYNSGIRKIIEFLPESIRLENSPTMYKAFRSVQLNTQREIKESSEVNSKILQDDTYYTALMDCNERGIPLLASEQIATSITVKKSGIIDSAGTLYGRAVRLRYKLADNFDSALRESLGEDADKFYVAREENKRRKQQEKAEQELKKSSERAKQISDNVRVNTQSSVKPQQSSSTRRKQVKHVDINPYIPPWVMFGIGGFLVSLIMLLYGQFTCILTLIATTIASYGWYCKEHNKKINNKSPVLFIAGGYLTVIVVLILKIM